MKFSEVLTQVIDLANKANAARAQRAIASGGFPIVTSGAQDQGQLGSMGAPPSPLEERALLQFLESQPPQTIYMLTAVMYLGRGDYDADSVVDNFALMRERFGGPRWAARQMADKIALPRYLEEGWKKATQAKIDLDATVREETAQTG